MEPTTLQQDNSPADEALTMLAQQDTLADEVALTQAMAAANDLHQDRLDVNVLKLLISRLAQILAQEVDLLDAMNILAIGGLQDEKKALIDALEKQKKMIARRARLLRALSEDEREDLRELVHLFEAVMQENYKRLLVAREVNSKVVAAITDLANENARQCFYTNKGHHGGDPSVSLSMSRSI